jgi:FixJ family two-component response regulator
MKIAVIDDDKSTLTSLARLIKSAGIEVLSFSSARAFLTIQILVRSTAR